MGLPSALTEEDVEASTALSPGPMCGGTDDNTDVSRSMDPGSDLDKGTRRPARVLIR
jgi:hypothetical protein